MNRQFRFGDMIRELVKSKRKAKDANETGAFPFFVCSSSIRRSDFDDYSSEAIILSTGGSAYVHYCNTNFSASGDTWVLATDQGRLDTKYAYYYLESKKQEIDDDGFQGSGLKHLRKDYIRDMGITLPPLQEQKKIAEILSAIDTFIALIKLQKKKNEKTLEKISTEVFGQLTESNPAKQLSDACALITKGATPTTFGHKLHGKAFESSVTFFGGGSTSETGEFDLDPARHCTQDAVSTLKRSQLEEGDTLVTIVGASIGNTCQIPMSVLPANINQNVALVRSDVKVLDKSFLNLFLRTEGRKMLVNTATTQAQPSVSLAQVGQLQIPIPNLDEQRRIISAVDGIRGAISLLNEKLCKCEYLREALSDDLLSGRKRVSV